MNLQRTIWACLLSTLAPLATRAADYTIQAGSTDVTVYVTLIPAAGNTTVPADLTGIAHNNADLKVYYVRDGGAVQQIMTAAQTITGAHADGGWVELSNTNATARYRLDLPDGVCAAGVRHAKVMVTHDGGEGVGDVDINLIGYDPTAANLPANVTQLDGDAIQQEDGFVSLSPAMHSTLAAKALATAGGYNNVLEVGAGKQYATIAAAVTAATAGDLVLIYPGIHSTSGPILKTDVYLYAARGVTLLIGSSLSDDANVTDCGLLGHARIAWNNPFGSSTSDVFLTNHGGTKIIECDWWSVLSGQAVEHNDGRTIIRGNVLSGTGSSGCLTANDSGLFVDVLELNASKIVDLGTTTALADVSVHRAIISGVDFVTGQAGRAILRGVFESNHASSNGISAPTGSTIWLCEGAVKVPSGRPPLSGSGTIYASDSFAYDTSAATATNIINTPTLAMYAKLPSKDFLTGTDNSTGDIQLDAATGEAAANTVKWAGVATDSSDMAIKSSLAKGTDITGFNDPTAAATASAVRSELATELARIDDSVTSRHAAGAAVASVLGDVEGNVDELQTYLDELFDNAPTFGEAMDGQGYTVARAAMLDNLDQLDMPVSDVAATMPSVLASTTIDALTDQANFTLAAGPPDDGALAGALVIVSSTDNSKKAVGLVRSYAGATRTVTLVADPSIFTMAAGDRVDVIASGIPLPIWLGSSNP